MQPNTLTIRYFYYLLYATFLILYNVPNFLVIQCKLKKNCLIFIVKYMHSYTRFQSIKLLCSIVSDDANADDINDANNDASDDTYFPLLPL